MRYVVYMHVLPNNKRYIGITCRKPEYRWNNGKGYILNKHFYNAILKYGWNNIEHIIIKDNLDKKDACNLEKELINKYKTTDYSKGYNHSIGGESGGLGVTFSEERRKKIGEARKGKQHTDEAKKKMSIAKKGKTSWNKGRQWTDREKEKMRLAQKTIKPVLCVETGIIYYGIRDAKNKTGINHSSIRNCCQKRKHCKTAGGYHWKYAS